MDYERRRALGGFAGVSFASPVGIFGAAFDCGGSRAYPEAPPPSGLDPEPGSGLEERESGTPGNRLTEDQRQLVEDHAYLVGWHMVKLKQRGIRLPPDSESDGQYGLVLAAKRYRPELGYRFSTIAGRYIVGGLLRHKRKRRRPILGTDLEHVPSRDQDEPSGTDAGDLIRRAIRLIDDPRSKQVAEMLAAGKTQDQIGKRLGVSDWETRMVIDRVRSWLSQILTGVPLRHYPSRKAATNQPMLPGMVDV